MRFVRLLSALAFCAVCACREEEITAYRIPKGTDAPAVPAQREVSWTVPEGWTEQPASGMRLGSFAVPGREGPAADMSVVALSGPAGGDLANINRWRGQIGLAPLSAGELTRHSRRIAPGG